MRNKKTNNRKSLARVSAAALAVTIGMGGFGLQSPVRAAESGVASSTAPLSLSYLSDPLRLEIGYLNAKADNALLMTSTFGFYEDSYRYHDMIAAQNQSYTLIMNPASSQAELAAAKELYEKKLNDFIDYYVYDGLIATHFSTVMYLLYYHSRIDQDESKLTSAERGEMHAARDAIAYTAELGGAREKGNSQRAYKEVYLPLSVKANDLKTYDVSTYQQLIANYRANAQTKLASVGGNASDYAASFQAFEQAAHLLDQVASSGYSWNQVKIAEGNLTVKYQALIADLGVNKGSEKQGLQDKINYAWTLTEMPKGIGPGQIPQSAFGDLRRAIRTAESAIQKGKNPADFNAAKDALSIAADKFIARKKPL